MKITKRQLRRIIREAWDGDPDVVHDYRNIVKDAGARGITHLDLLNKLLDLGMLDEDEDKLADLMFDDVMNGKLDPAAFEDGRYIWIG
jgi:hypothetical protein